MSWTLRLPADRPWLELTYSGLVSRAELHEALQAVLELVPQLEHLLLFADCRDLEGGHSPVDLLQLIEHIDALPLTKPFREAILMREGRAAEAVHFYEMACRNRGIQVRVFEERSAAEAWLELHAQPPER
ncbi:MAG: hypothetical protein WC326_05950 [Candidatus Delongbacteria bacterium]